MKASDVLKYAHCFVGIRYRWGGNNSISGFDCSGLTCELLKSAGVLHYSQDLSAQDLAAFCLKSHGKGDIKEGSIIFFGSDKHVSHVAIAIDEKTMIEAGGGDSSVVNLEMADIKNAFVRIRPISMRKDFLFASNVFE